MNFAIIRNVKYQRKNLAGIYRHIERKNTNYSNKDINKDNSINNYSIKKINTTYEKAFDTIRKQYNLKGQIKVTSNIACEFIITSSKSFFENIGPKETKRYFETAYKFVVNHKNLGEQYILSAKVHLDETTPHLHIVFIPVIHTKDKQNNNIDKISCSEFWKGKDSYQKLQDNFYSYMTKCGFKLERGNAKGNEHLSIETLKDITEYDNIKYELEKADLKPKETNNIQELKEQNKQLIRHCSTLRGYYIKSTKAIEKYIELKEENQDLKIENENLKNENTKLKSYLNKTFEVVKHLFNFPIDRLKRIIDDFIK